MPMRLPALTAVVCLVGLIPTAHAGSTSGSSDSGTTESSGSGSSSGTVDDTSASATDPGCDCPSGDDALTFEAPDDNADVASPFTVTVEALPRCPCFDCSCAAEDPDYVQLFVDSLIWGGACFESPCTWDVSASIGGHTLTTAATYPGGEATQSIFVTITSVDAGTSTTDPPPDPTTDAPPDAETTTTSSGSTGASDPAPGGCSCTAQPLQPQLLGAPAVLLLLGMRRRPRT